MAPTRRMNAVTVQMIGILFSQSIPRWTRPPVWFGLGLLKTLRELSEVAGQNVDDVPPSAERERRLDARPALQPSSKDRQVPQKIAQVDHGRGRHGNDGR